MVLAGRFTNGIISLVVTGQGCACPGDRSYMLDSCLASIRAGLISLGTLFSLSGAYPLTRGENSQAWPHFHSPWSMTNAAGQLPADHLAHLWGWESELEKYSSWEPDPLLLSGLGPSPELRDKGDCCSQVFLQRL